MYRLVTRSDFDGLVCAMLLKQLELIDDITFVHPKDVQDGAVPITAADITTNLPPLTSTSADWIKNSFSASSSWLTSIRSAWKTCARYLFSLPRGIRFTMAFFKSATVFIDPFKRVVTIVLASDLAF